jgi:ABC-type branched-subunit amino acid transport system ATPase component
MNYGQKLAEGTLQDVMNDTAVQRVYLGIEA